MNISAITVVIVFWVPVFVSLLYHFTWDLQLWQKKDYMLTRLSSNLRWDFELNHRLRTYYLVKLLGLVMVVYFFIDKLSTLPMWGMLVSFAVYAAEALHVLEKSMQRRTAKLKLSWRNITIIFIAIALFLALVLAISYPLVLQNATTSTAGTVVGLLPFAGLNNITLLPSLYVYLIFAVLIAATIDLAIGALVSVLVLLTKPLELIQHWLLRYRVHMLLQMHPDLIKVCLVGNYGKSTVKKLLESVLGPKGHVASTKHTLTGFVGIMQSLLQFTYIDTKVFVAEVNAYEAKEFEAIGKLLRPNLIVFTGIDDSQTALFGSQTETLAANTLLLKQLAPDGLAIFNGDDDLVTSLAGNNESRELLYSYQRDPHRQLSRNELEIDSLDASDISTENNSLKLTLTTGSKKLPVELHTSSSHILSSILACIGITTELGYPLETIIARLQKLNIHDSFVEELPGDNDTVILVDKRRVSKKVFVQALNRLSQHSGSKVLITTGIKELGSYKTDVYADLATQITNCVEVLITSDAHLAHQIEQNNTNTRVSLVNSIDDLIYNARTQSTTGTCIFLLGEIDGVIVAELTTAGK